MSELTIEKAIELYENGKQRRYSLLFAVNGGAFAIAKILVGKGGSGAVVVGCLTLQWLAVGMVAFTVIMVFDIFKFGEKMSGLKPAAQLFRSPGKFVLIALGLLLCAGWLLGGSPWW